jgi:hypothetical protein
MCLQQKTKSMHAGFACQTSWAQLLLQAGNTVIQRIPVLWFVQFVCHAALLVRLELVFCCICPQSCTALDCC